MDENEKKKSLEDEKGVNGTERLTDTEKEKEKGKRWLRRKKPELASTTEEDTASGKWKKGKKQRQEKVKKERKKWNDTLEDENDTSVITEIRDLTKITP